MNYAAFHFSGYACCCGNYANPSHFGGYLAFSMGGGLPLTSFQCLFANLFSICLQFIFYFKLNEFSLRVEDMKDEG